MNELQREIDRLNNAKNTLKSIFIGRYEYFLNNLGQDYANDLAEVYDENHNVRDDVKIDKLVNIINLDYQVIII